MTLGRAFLFVLGYLWALPTTLIGFVLAFGGLCLPVETKGGAVWFRVATTLSPWAWWWAKRFSAITFGGCVITSSGIPDDDLVRHELRHFAQARVLGPFFVPVYLALSLWALIRGGSAYADNPLEVDARNAARLA